MFYRAFFFDKKGEFVGKTSFNGKETFKYKEGRYYYDSSNLSYFENNHYWLFFTRRTFFYQVGNPNPINFNKTILDVNKINADQFNVIFETEVAKKLNDLSKKGLFANLNMKTVLIGLIILGVAIYLISGGKLT